MKFERFDIYDTIGNIEEKKNEERKSSDQRRGRG